MLVFSVLTRPDSSHSYCVHTQLSRPRHRDFALWLGGFFDCHASPTMSLPLVLALALALGPAQHVQTHAAAAPPPPPPSGSVAKARAMLGRMNTSEKVAMLHGYGAKPEPGAVGLVHGNRRLGIPPIVLANGPQGYGGHPAPTHWSCELRARARSTHTRHAPRAARAHAVPSRPWARCAAALGTCVTATLACAYSQTPLPRCCS